MRNLFAFSLLIALFVGFIFAADALAPVTAVDQRTFEIQTGQSLSNPLSNVPSAGVSDYIYDMGEGKTLEKPWSDLTIAVHPENNYVSFTFSGQKMVDLMLIAHKKSSQSGTTGLFDFMIVDYTKNPDGTERLITSVEAGKPIETSPPKLLFFRASEDSKIAVTIPGVGKFTEFSVDELFFYNPNEGQIEDFKVAFDDSFYHSLPALIEKRKQGPPKPVQPCKTIPQCLAQIDKNLVDQALKTLK